MSLPKKNTRVVHVDGKQFRYIIKPYNKGEQPVVKLFAQEDCDKPGNVLELDLSNVVCSCSDELVEQAYALLARAGENPGFGPGDVVKIVQQAMILGWEPTKKGPAFIPPGKIEITRK